MSICLDHAGMARATSSLDSRATDMAARRASIDSSVESLLSHWRGDAAVRFAALWEEWRSSADVVIDNLSTDVGAVRYSGSLLADADQGVDESHARLRGRLG